MIVRVKGYLTFRAVVGDHRLDLPDERICTLRTLLDRLEQDIGGENAARLMDSRTGDLQADIALLVNGHSIKNLPSKLETVLEDGDEIAIFPPIMGGRLPD
jgi:MoaD family protein